MSDELTRYYEEQVRLYGNDVRSLAWGSRESQETRFRVLSEMLPLKDRRVVDVGCGLGDFYGWLKRAGIPCRYAGVDLSPGMIELARRNHPDAEFLVGDIGKLDDPRLRGDFVVASGIFNLVMPDHDALMWGAVARMLELCREAAAFNVMSVRAPVKKPGQFYADPDAALARARTLAPRAVLRHDYMVHDFTLVLPKP